MSSSVALALVFSSSGASLERSIFCACAEASFAAALAASEALGAPASLLEQAARGRKRASGSRATWIFMGGESCGWWRTENGAGIRQALACEAPRLAGRQGLAQKPVALEAS